MMVLPTIDGDPGANFPQRPPFDGQRQPTVEELDAYRAAVSRLLSVFAEHGLAGGVTWFLNERDVGWSRHYADLLDEFASRGDTVALHVHHDDLFRSPKLATFDAVLEATREAKEALEAVTGKRCFCHRSGCYFQAPFVYEALKALGFEAVSDVFPGYKDTTAARFFLDNSSVPLGASPWRHDCDNWMDFTSTSGHFLQVPVSAGGLGGLPGLPDALDDCSLEVVCWGLHPHELQNPDGSLSQENVDLLEQALERMDSLWSPTYTSLAEFAKPGAPSRLRH